MNLRLGDELRKQLEVAARESGRDLSEEIRSRLRSSFNAVEFGVPETQVLAYAIALALQEEKSATGLHWFQDPWAFQRAVAAINEAMLSFEPGGDPDIVPTDARPLQRLRARGFERSVEAMAEELKDHSLGKKSGTWAIAKLEAAADGRISRLADLRLVAGVAKEMLKRLGADTAAIKELTAGISNPFEEE